MNIFEVPGKFYDSQQEDGNIALIRKLAERTYRRRSDNYNMQAEALEFCSKNAELMNEFLRKSKAEIQKFQLLTIKKLVDNAYKNVPFYRELYGAAGYEVGGISSFSDFEQLPIINKKLLGCVDAGSRVAAPEYLEQAHTARTSGSSGRPFTVYRDDSYINIDHGQYLRFYSSCLKTPLQENDWIYLLHHAPLAFSSLHGNYRIFQLPDLLPNTPLGDHLLFLRPRLLVILPSYLPLILQHKDELIKSGVEAILTNSESSTRRERSYYSSALGIPVFDEYSSEEIGLIATQCTYGQYHVTEDSAYVEIVNMDAQGFGSVICTDLKNGLMPMIRLDHGDIAKKTAPHINCKCGSAFTLIDEVNGRQDDAFRTREHRLVPSASILGAIDDILLDGDQTLTSFRLTQKSAETIELVTRYLGAPYKDMEETLRRLRERLSSLFGYSITLLHQEVEALPETKSYKRKSIVREWEIN